MNEPDDTEFTPPTPEAPIHFVVYTAHRAPWERAKNDVAGPLYIALIAVAILLVIAMATYGANTNATAIGWMILLGNIAAIAFVVTLWRWPTDYRKP